MSRLSIEITPEQHQQLKAMAALHGKSIKQYILERAMPTPDAKASSPEAALRQLERFLEPRVKAAERGEVVSKSVRQIFDEVSQEHE